MTFFVTFVW